MSNTIYTVIIEDYFLDSVHCSNFFMSFDQELAISKAKSLFEQNTRKGSQRPNLINYDYTMLEDHISRIFVTETPMDQELTNSKSTNIVWTTSLNPDKFENFRKTLIKLFQYDLNIAPNESEILEIWELFNKKERLFVDQKRRFRDVINSADILKLLQKEREFSDMMDMENKLRQI